MPQHPRLALYLKWLLTDETGREARNNRSRLSILQHARVAGGSKLYELDPTEAQALLVQKVWLPTDCALLPPGIDYWMFDLSFRFGKEIAARWLNIALFHSDPPLKITESTLWVLQNGEASHDLLIYEMDVLVRRRLKLEKDWSECNQWLTNRANRARARAIKALSFSTDGSTDRAMSEPSAGSKSLSA